MMRLLIFALFCLVVNMPHARAEGAVARTLKVGTMEREYTIYRPVKADKSKPASVVIMLHGGFGTPAQAEEAYGWNALADQQGFVVVYPEGKSRSWNAGGECCGKANKNNVDDVWFLTQLIEQLATDENISLKNIYIAGMSNGAAMAYRYACEGEYPVAAIGAVAGSFAYACPKLHAPVSVVEIHGTDDQHVPLAGGKGSKSLTPINWLGVDQTLDVFRQSDHCKSPVANQKGKAHWSISMCEKGVKVLLITIDGAKHQWPGSKERTGWLAKLLPLDPPMQRFNTTQTLWNFFASSQSQ